VKWREGRVEKATSLSLSPPRAHTAQNIRPPRTSSLAAVRRLAYLTGPFSAP